MSSDQPLVACKRYLAKVFMSPLSGSICNIWMRILAQRSSKLFKVVRPSKDPWIAMRGLKNKLSCRRKTFWRSSMLKFSPPTIESKSCSTSLRGPPYLSYFIRSQMISGGARHLKNHPWGHLTWPPILRGFGLEQLFREHLWLQQLQTLPDVICPWVAVWGIWHGKQLTHHHPRAEAGMVYITGFSTLAKLGSLMVTDGHCQVCRLKAVLCMCHHLVMLSVWILSWAVLFQLKPKWAHLYLTRAWRHQPWHSWPQSARVLRHCCHAGPGLRGNPAMPRSLAHFLAPHGGCGITRARLRSPEMMILWVFSGSSGAWEEITAQDIAIYYGTFPKNRTCGAAHGIFATERSATSLVFTRRCQNPVCHLFSPLDNCPTAHDHDWSC